MDKSMMIDVIGYLAATFSAFAQVPQVVMTWQKKRAEGISLGTYILVIVSSACWMGYGIWLGALPITIANAVALVSSVFILGMKLIYD